jgi:agmatine/peptidylarginine deiminase
MLLDFQFNGWGKKFPAEKDNAINKHLWQSGILSSLLAPQSPLLEIHYQDHNDFVLEGGSIESDGRGTIYTTRCCLMAPNRNQPLTEQEIEEELKRRLCADRIVWLDDEPLPGDDTDGHIDTIARITPDGTLLRLPLPDPILDEDGTQLPATYANYLIINGAVLVPTYNQPENDQRAIRLIQAAFPDREMVPIDSSSIIKQHGSIHCCTMQYY